MSLYDWILTGKEFVDKNDLSYPFEERGLQFGDGVYEVIRIYEGEYYLIDEHVERLYRSAAAIKIDVPFQKQELYAHLHELLNKNSVRNDATMYLQLTRGSAPRDHAFPLNTEANLYAYVKDFARDTDSLEEGASAITMEDIRWEWCYIKSLNLLPNVLAKQNAKELGAKEAILHKDGMVTEGSSSNIYLVREGKVYTHPATKRILGGCVRMKIEEFCKEADIPFIEEAFRIEDFKGADEVFMTSSTSEVQPLTKVDEVTIGDGRPGPVTRKLQASYEKDAGITGTAAIFSGE
ncbi:D-amino-acid transaminase [Salimicrobium humidisoli]|uniref:D-alanine aminotransferase n=1 Tax=Salimicrobium humidisoli TaxID=2029857 RepID=A0ABX4HQA3_9BACI|nr:D-amino-acid transaminase [Salimicrobium humidisoli]PBB05369.1 D-amino-acid transaminase [Salimicrobium humidisoli]